MPTVRVCSLNAEWMNDWFTPDAEPAALRPTFTRDGGVNDTEATAGRLAGLIRAIDPDILALQEAPSRPAELALFIERFLSDDGTPRYASFLGDSGGAQKLALLYKPAAVDAAQLAPHATIGALIEPWLSDVNGDAILDEYQFTRVPLVVDCTLGGHRLQLVVAHTKSNFINHGRALWENEATRLQYVVGALRNRRRISSEAIRLRRYVDQLLLQDPAARVVILGDLNDGPGRDHFEELYLTHNVTDILVGSTFEPERIFDHAQHDVDPGERYTAVFDDFVTGEANRHLLLDHILLSPGLLTPGGLRRVPGSGAIHHAAYQAHTANQGLRREDRPSDHRPVGVQLTY
ncbi:MAG TPA: endonuclease/exonuclease/phosphatase family protein [Chloroflexota bacterium]|nr:endonuclease/exonuclease/phosphatase family protein [Chloroflexota bacterium]